MPRGWRRLAQRTVALKPRGERPGGREHPRGSPQAGRVARSSPGSSTTPAASAKCSTISAGSNCSKAISSKRPRASRRRLRIARRLGARWLSADAIWGFAEVAAAAGDADRAARLAGAARALGGSSGAGFDLTVLTRLTAHLNEVRAALGEQAWQKARDEGAALDLDAALRLALDR